MLTRRELVELEREHLRKAEELANPPSPWTDRKHLAVARAQVHATLALYYQRAVSD